MGGHERVGFKPLRPKKTGTICGEEELHYIDRSNVPVGRQWACQTGELPTIGPIGSVRSGYPIEGAAALGFRHACFADHRAWSYAASDLL